MRTARSTVLIVAAVLAALVLQTTVLPDLLGIVAVPNLLLLLTGWVAMRSGTDRALAVGLGAGLLLDLVPPADHFLGQWALAFVLVAYVLGRAIHQMEVSKTALLGALLAGAFIGESVFALTGLLFGATDVGVADVLPAVLTSVLSDGVVIVLLLIPAAAVAKRLNEVSVAA